MASRRDEVLLEGEFQLLSKKRTPYKLCLTRGGLYYSLNSSSANYDEKSIQISDIIGCHSLDPTCDQQTSTITTTNLDDCEDSKDLHNCEVEPRPTTPTNIGFPKLLDPSTAGFIVFAYPFRKKVFSSKKTRYRVVIGFCLPKSTNEVYEERKKRVDIWRNVINCLSRDIPVDKDSIASTIAPTHGKILVLINPRSGPGKAHTIFKTSVQPMLQEASIPFKSVITEYSGHATDILKDLELSDWYGIVIVSGDGLIFETINGIMSRGDWLSSIQIPIGCLPGGSGNALCCSLNYAAGEPLNSNMALHSTFVLIKHRVLPMDLVIIHVPDATLYSFLSITWGIIADIDYESEKYRNLGEARFTVGALKRILGLRTYKGRISFLPVAEYRPKEQSQSSRRILSKIRSFSLRSRSSSKSTLNSLEETNSPQLLKHRSLSMGQSGYSESIVHRADIDYSEEIDKLAGGDLESKPDKMLGNGHDRLPGPTNSEDEATSLSDYVTTGSISSEVASNAAESVENYESAEPSHTPALIQNGSINTDPKNETDMSRNNYCVSEDSVFTEMNGNHSSVSKDSADSYDNHAKSVHVSGHRKTESDVSFTVMEETQEIKVEQETYTGSKADFAPVPSPLLRPLDQPVPDNWVILEDDYVLVCAVYQTHLGSDMMAAPDARLNDGFIHLMMVKEGISRNALLNLFLSFGEGAHVHSPFVDYVKVLAFRLEPEDNVGNIMIDGERYKPTALQAQILPGVAKVMAIR